MSKIPDSIPNNPQLKAAEDYYRLRREGIGFIAEMGSALWTDYNTHDPGITILESLCYAITDLAYRLGWPIVDLLMPETPSTNPQQPFPNQAFFTARDILTVNPVTPDDFRQLLIGLDAIRNAWVFCKECACESGYYAWSANGQLQLGYHAPQTHTDTVKVAPQGLYDILLELETDPELGDLNDRKISQTFTEFDADGNPHPVLLELRFPDWRLANLQYWRLFLNDQTRIGNVEVSRFSATKQYNLLADPEFAALTDVGREAKRDQYLRDHWRTVFYLDFIIGLSPGGGQFAIENVALRISGDSAAKAQTTLAALLDRFGNAGTAGFIQHYQHKLQKAEHGINQAKAVLQQHRNLAEDYCRVKIVDIEDVTVCADIEVAADADIERVQAEVWLAIENYLAPPVPFYSLSELLAAKMPVEGIFNGPKLSSGFIKADDLQAASLKPVLRTSDIINSLMDIKGIIAVNNLLLSKYDAEGNLVKGSADPAWTEKGAATFDGNRISAAWLLYISPLHQPRLHRTLSRFLFFKNGLPFLPRKDEANDTLVQLRGQTERPKIKNTDEIDLPIPSGTYRDPEAYFPLQYGLPAAYGLGPEGLPSQASAERKAQAKQLKAYLLVFEQLLANAQAQIAHTADLFSLDANIRQTYFAKLFDGQLVKGYDGLAENLSEDALHALVETQSEFYGRRNRFLDHLLARFGEQFNEYTLLLTQVEGRQKALAQLVDDKIAFLKAYPDISHNRGKAFNYQANLDADNVAGLKTRVALLLGWEAGERSIVVEHLLLRPKFPGDALFPVCSNDSNGDRAMCGDIDPYSFRLTWVMPGWLPPYDTHLELRGFADRTIRKETPAHLLAKVCWVGNDGFLETANDPMVCSVADLLLAKAVTAAGVRPSEADACACAAAIASKFGEVFKAWYQDKTLAIFHPDAFTAALTAEFSSKIKVADFTCTAVLAASLWAEIQALMVKQALSVAINGWQFERFELAWRQWLVADAQFDWSAEQLPDELQAILKASRVDDSPETALCQCRSEILTAYGTAFQRWMLDNIAAGHEWDAGPAASKFTGFQPVTITVPEEDSQSATDFCPGFRFKAGTSARLQALLDNRYQAYQEVSYRLSLVVNLLGKLSNTYPDATLHDCDDGSDQNPVRLGQTALGSLPASSSPSATI
ncbi:MAG: hypothetical protein WAW36_00275 [Methylovulum miyakonense]|uniref:hypothetical protein n=1 Tax=Methylovulum miyakonense TaxID=645578 RepID=UPI003BB4B566